MRNKIISVNPYFPEPNFIEDAARLLSSGRIVIFPTETVYGAGVNFLDKKAVEKLCRIKKRPSDKPFAAAIGKIDILKKLDIELTHRLKSFIDRYWPGPLTLIVLNKHNEKIGIRMPDNKIALTLLDEADLPIALPSANISGEKEPASIYEIKQEFLDSVDMVLDGGTTELATPSTILDITTTPFTILREGAVSKDDLFSDIRVLFVCTGNSCRSVMAEYIMKKFVKEAGLSNKIYVESAGTIPCGGAHAADNTILALKEGGMDASNHKGKPITQYLLRKSDLIIVMENMHRNIVLSRLLGIQDKVRLLKEGEDIPDPIGKPIEEYRRVKNIIKEQVENIFLELFKKEKK